MIRTIIITIITWSAWYASAAGVAGIDVTGWSLDTRLIIAVSAALSTIGITWLMRRYVEASARIDAMHDDTMRKYTVTYMKGE